MNNKGFAGIGFIVGLLVAVICIVFSMALTPVISQSFGMARGSDAANCPGYVDPNAATLGQYNHSYLPVAVGGKQSDTLTCTVTDFGTGMIVLSIIFGIIAGILTGSFGQSEPQPQYNTGYYQ